MSRPIVRTFYSFGIDLFVSNPSFEVFLLMHFQDVKGRMSQDDMEDALSRHLGRRYDKAKGIRIDEDMVRTDMGRADISISGKDDIATISSTPGTTNFQKLLSKISEQLR